MSFKEGQLTDIPNTIRNNWPPNINSRRKTTALLIEKKSMKSATPTVVEASTAVAGACTSCPVSNHLLRTKQDKAGREHSLWPKNSTILVVRSVRHIVLPMEVYPTWYETKHIEPYWRIPLLGCNKMSQKCANKSCRHKILHHSASGNRHVFLARLSDVHR